MVSTLKPSPDAEESLRRERDLSSAILDTVGALIVVLDPQGRIARFNRACERITGWRAGEVMGRCVWDLFLPSEEVEAVKEVFSDLCVRRLPNAYEGYWVARNGRRRRIAWSNTVLADAHGSVEYVIGTGIDVTERRHAEDALRESEERFRRYFELKLIGMATTSPDKSWCQVNDRLCEIFGYSREELVTKTWAELTHPDDLQADVKQFNRVLAGEIDGYSMEKRFIRKDGEVIHAHISAKCLRKPDGGVDYFVAVVQDITQQKRAQDALRESEHQLRLITDAVPVLISYIDCHARYRFNNKAYEEWFGCPASEATGRHLREVLGDAAFGHIEPYLKAALLGKRVSFEAALPYKDGGERYVRASYVPHITPDGTVRGFFAVIADITDEKRAQEREKQRMLELAHISRLSTMGEMAAEIAHELNQPLTAIANYGDAATRLLEKKSLEGSEIVSALQGIKTQAARAGEIIRRLRAYVGKKDIQLVSVDLDGIIRDVTRLVQIEARMRGIGIDLTLGDALPEIAVDRILIEQVLVNLLRNAIEAMGAAETGPRTVYVRSALRTDRQILVTVEDSGPGLPDTDPERLFEAFYTTKAEGMGMGLAICRSILETHGGHLWAEPNTPKGAKFHFVLPIEGT